MAILIEGKTICPLCHQPIFSSRDAVGFPRVDFPPNIAVLADSVVHRICLEKHPSKEAIRNRWAEFWKVQALNADAQAMISEHGIIFRGKGRLVWISLAGFIEIEESLNDLDKLQEFFASMPPDQNLKATCEWNTYEIQRDANGVRLIISSTPRSVTSAPYAGKSSSAELLNYYFSLTDWSNFSKMWHNRA